MPAPAVAPSARTNINQVNMAQRQQLIQNSIKKKQQIFSFTGTPASVNNILNIGGQYFRMAGLLTRLIVEFTGTLAQLGSGTTAETNIGRANCLSNIQFTDLQNNQRHNCPGLQLALTSSIKRPFPFGTAFTSGSSFTSNQQGSVAPLSTFTAPTTGAAGSVRQVYEIPVSVTDQDLRGAIFLGVYGSQLSLQLTINPSPGPATGDDTFAVTYGSGATSFSSVTVNVYQEYYDNIPMVNGAYLLPSLDISSVYQLIAQNFTAISPAQDYFIPFANYRKYLSQSMIYNNSGTVGGRTFGTDMSYLQIVAANFSPIIKEDPLERFRVQREMFQTDLYQGLYVYKSYHKPIDTQNYGNMQLGINPSTAGASAYAYVMSEFIAYQNQIAQAPSLPSK